MLLLSLRGAWGGAQRGVFSWILSPVRASRALAVPSWKGHGTALVLPPGSDEDGGERPDGVPAADQGEPLEVGAGQRAARLQERQTRVHRGHAETPRVRAGLGWGQPGFFRASGMS